MVLWLCSLVFGFWALGRLRTGGNVEWRGRKICCELLIMNFVVALEDTENVVLL